ncbi:MAG: PAS domain-containing protein [Burkholderiales bacterium]|nr:PAS domain-containing protein [Burkholderiales bacterium]
MSWTTIVLAAPDQPGHPAAAFLERHADPGLLGALLLALGLGLWNLILRRRLREQTRALSRSLDALGDANERAEQTIAQLNATLQAVPDLLFELDIDGRYLDYRAARTDLLVLPPDQLLGRTVSEVMPPESANTVLAALKEAAHKGTANGAQLQLDVPQGACWFELSIAVKRSPCGQADRFIVLSRDVTERVQASRAKTDFLSRMSHELRTPMNAILGFSQLLERDTALQARPRGFATEILRAGKHLLNLINDVLDLTQVESGRLTLSMEPVQLTDLAHDVMTLMQAMAQQRDVTLRWDAFSGVAVRADRLRLKQVLLNLVSNAVKYNRPGGSVHLQATPHGEHMIRITVRDTGTGIACERMAQMYQPFNRLGAEFGPIEGTGIGLSTCQRLMDLMGGSIGARSTPGEGSEFWIDLPALEGALPWSGDSEGPLGR